MRLTSAYINHFTASHDVPYELLSRLFTIFAFVLSISTAKHSRYIEYIVGGVVKWWCDDRFQGRTFSQL